MKETGVIRRIDELGRIVVPKEIRRHLRINVGDQLDIFTSDKKIILSKYQPLDEVINPLKIFVDGIYKENNTKIVVSDSNKVIVSTIEEFPINLEIKDSFLSIIKKNEIYELNSQFDLEISNEIRNDKNCYIKRVMSNGDFLGFVMVISEGFISKTEKGIVNILANFIEKTAENEI